MTQEYETCRKLIEKQLDTYFVGDVPQSQLSEAMRYSLLAGGKRLRPVLVVKFAEACGGDVGSTLPVACAVEMMHTYSLIHDDLPCMDNDILRRGKPTNHVVFGEFTATLAGDALQAAAFSTLLGASLPPQRLAAAGHILALSVGERGMCLGQELDMEGECRELTMDQVASIHELKTAALIRASAKIGVVAGGGSEEQLAAADEYAEALGLAFQLRDDLLDYTSTAQELGKSVGTDKDSGKATFVTLLGFSECERLIAEKTEDAKKAVRSAFQNPEFFCWLADTLASRKK